jgi:hypothetical protein
VNLRFRLINSFDELDDYDVAELDTLLENEKADEN